MSGFDPMGKDVKIYISSDEYPKWKAWCESQFGQDPDRCHHTVGPFAPLVAGMSVFEIWFRDVEDHALWALTWG